MDQTNHIMAESPDDILTSPTAARIAGIDRVHFARLIREGKGPRHQTINAGGSCLTLIARKDLKEWISSKSKCDAIRRCTVYVLADGTGLYKIGRAIDVTQRIKQLQTGNGRLLSLHAYVECEGDWLASRVESATHRHLKHFRRAGEWFSCSANEAVNAICFSAATCGLSEGPVVVGLVGKQHREIMRSTHGR